MSALMDAANEKVAERCRATSQVAQKAIDWFNDNPDKVRQELPTLTREFRKLALQARKYEAAAHRPMCVGVFGPSQAGKSYLISALARRGTNPLMAVFDSHPEGIDFVKEINPEGGQEATGLVTRFSIRPVQAPAGAPVALRLLSQTDIVKIIANTYMSDCDLSEEEPLTQAKLREVFEAVQGSAQPGPVDPMTEDDVYDLQEYFDKYFKGKNDIVRALSTGGYWSQAAELAPRLPVAARAKLFSPLWGGIDEFSDLYRELYAALSQLGFPADAFCGIDALIPRDISIINVSTLRGLGGDDPTGTLDVVSPSGQRASLPRSAVTALIAELRILIKEKPWDFFDHTDLLDFPGARSRENIPDVRKYLSGQDTGLHGLFLRGKVAYLYERYCAEQELTSMLLCIGPSNQEVRTLPAMIKDWIDGTHGAEPAERAKLETALFLVLTKFDAEFEDKAGQSADSKERWTIRLNASLLDFFGKAHDWPREWTPGQPFHNTFWMRNPNYKAKAILDYDEAGTEVAIRRGEETRIAGFREDFIANEDVQRHFANPAKAWDEAFRLNDGGISHLAGSLAPVCNPEIKRRQIDGRIDLQRAQMQERLSRYFISGDLDEELRKRKAAAAMVVRNLAQCVQSQRFGQLLRAFQMRDADLADLYYDVETYGSNGRAAAEDGGGQKRPQVTIGRAVDADELLADVFGETTLPPIDMDAADAEPASAPAALDHAELFAEEVLKHWMTESRLISETPRLCRYFRMSEPSISTLASELIAGAGRLDLRTRIAEQVRQITAFRQKLDRAAAKPALVAANIINAYVNWLGLDVIAPDERPTAGRGEQRRTVFAPRPAINGQLSLPSEPTRYDQIQYVDWMAAFIHLVEQNASNQDGGAVDVEENARLGALLRSLDAAA